MGSSSNQPILTRGPCGQSPSNVAEDGGYSAEPCQLPFPSSSSSSSSSQFSHPIHGTTTSTGTLRPASARRYRKIPAIVESTSNLGLDHPVMSTQPCKPTDFRVASSSTTKKSVGGALATRSAASAASPTTGSTTTTTTTTTTMTMTKSGRTIPRSRHCGSPTPSDSDEREEDKFAPHKTTAEGFPVNNKVKKAKYATSIDDRGFLTVYEFQLNDQTIMWDYVTGLVHLTGIWKALGNSKADIVRLVENHPELEGVIKRIRGGFLKIQGTWVPYELCRRLAIRTCYTIRHALISVFGPAFPDECLKPGLKGYGTLTLDDTGVDKRRKKRKPVAPLTHAEDLGSMHAPSYATTYASCFSVRDKRPRHAHKATEIALNSSVSSSSALSQNYARSRSQSPDADMEDYMPVDKASPPSLPRIVNLPHNGYYPSKVDLLDMLRASRSLQKLSAGSDAEDWPAKGGHFNIAGGTTTFFWDGSDALDVLGRSAVGETYADGEGDGDGSSGSGAWSTGMVTDQRQQRMHTSPPPMARKYSSATQESSLGDYPITPPQSYPALDPLHYASAIPDYRGPRDSYFNHFLLPMTKVQQQQQQYRGSGLSTQSEWSC